MREIKFQGIYKPTKEKFIPHNINFNSKTVVGDFDGEIGDWCHFSLESSGYGDVWLRQYTGLKDKNAREIYEGDILRVWEEDEHVPNHDSGGGIIDFDIIEGFSQLGVVDFKGAWFTYETKKHQKGREVSIFAPLDFTNNFEVISNIYENPELLEASHASK
ncbi:MULTISPECIES: YopX family protein [Bacillus]|uniref:YopX family protein n=1 Tax=Bacillus TaxID=1386 RepID=UPI000A08F682|nr:MULTISPECIES: YopX family protein [Bacillus subtilis group]MBR0019392.1 hypothetical protein [Bacillus subtilis]MED3672052.1 YopX family protein [Bacillus subtilis]MED4458355.1 YopX family protein [Bacillus subtilis]MED4559268.1 YopX family protein [Bacillus subtilis]MED4627352.1 YopX family protein [Bacillus velezensis]